MTRANIIIKVQGCIDEITPFDEAEIVSESLIDSLLDDSDNEIRRKLPVHTITPSAFSTTALVDNGDGTGYIPLPNDFLRLHSFKMEEWRKTVSEAITESNPKYNLQKSTITRGGIIKPVLVIRWDQITISDIGAINNQKFIATAGQTIFTVTEFTLNDDYMVFVDGILTSGGHSRVGDVVTFASGLPEGTEVVIAN